MQTTRKAVQSASRHVTLAWCDCIDAAEMAGASDPRTQPIIEALACLTQAVHRLDAAENWAGVDA